MRLRLHFALLAAPILAASLFTSVVPANAADLSGTASAATVLAQLTVAPADPVGYDRTLFVHWIDADGNGCDTRQEVLMRSSTVPVTKSSGCTITAGRWTSWYDGATWTAPSDVDIDHLVPLGEAWASGASSWTPDQRRAYANDLALPVALQAVTDNVNQSKGDRDPAQWMPPLPGVACQYATDWVLVKYRWNLTIDTAEQATLSGILSGTCGQTVVAVPDKAGTSVNAGVSRISGQDRYGTAVAVSGQYPTGVPVVYVASGANFPDALSAAPAAARQGGPLLLTAPGSLPAVVRTELQRLAPDTIVVAGGTGSVSEAVYNDLSTLAPHIRRDAGATRYATSIAVNTAAFPTGSASAFVATGRNFPDALGASAAAGSLGEPVLLVDGNAGAIDQPTLDLMTTLGVSTVSIAGGTASISSGIENQLRGRLGSSNVVRLAGVDRYHTASAINRATFASSRTVYLAAGTGFADALAGAALAGRDHDALYVIPGTCIPDFIKTDLAALGTTKRVLLGGTGSLSIAVANYTTCATAPPAPPKPPAPPAPTKPANPGDTKNCSDFATHAAAQAWFNTYYPYYGDVARLDSDNDGIA
ncbi:MAG TPA: cell wall-binding repeat-containing protein, partial [Diaminobutyricibacter sp.]